MTSIVIRVNLVIFVLSLMGYKADAQSTLSAVGGAHNASLANTGTLFTGIQAIYTNPAGLVSVDGYAFDIGYHQRYNLRELSTVSLAGARKIGSGAIGLSINRYGYSAYSENKVGLTYARKLSPNVSIGGTFDYLSYNIDQFGNTSLFTFEFGVQSKINDKFQLGGYVFSPTSVSLTQDQDVPAIINVGFKYTASSKADIYFDIAKTINRDPDFKFAIDYRMISSLSLRGGANITQSSVHFGPAYTSPSGLSIGVGYSFDNRLGHSTALSITYQ